MKLHDALLASALLQSAYREGTALALNTDLNDITTPGMYRSDNKTATASMLNTPPTVSGHGFALEVFTSSAYPSVVQRVTWGNYNSHVPNCVIRCARPIDGVMTWGAWYKFSLTLVSETATTQLDTTETTEFSNPAESVTV